MWRFLHASIAGKSHVSQGIPCQDFHVLEKALHNGHDCLIVALADGAGSAKFAAEAAKFACEDWIKKARDFLAGSDTVEEAHLVKWSEETSANLKAVAQASGHPIEQYSCTLLGAVILKDQALFFQMGDGGWIAQNETGLVPVTWPEQFEFAGQTRFLISSFLSADGSQKNYQTATMTKPLAVAGFTDGLQQWALIFKNKTVNSAFFQPMFEQMTKTSDLPSLQPPFMGFLDSDMINARTGDDKTLVLIAREIGDAAGS